MPYLLWAGMFFGQADGDALFDLKSILAPPLNARALKTTEKDGIVTEEVRFFSEKDGAKTVEIFALFSYPKGAKSLPAFIWNQGGLYQATTHFTELGARRGYAALCIDFPLPGYRSSGGYPITSGLELTDDPRQAPIFHGAVALLRAVSFLESRPEVDKEKIGMAGSSWGGFYTTLMAGVDPRLKAASAMFGGGNLQSGNNWWDGAGKDPKRDDAFRKRWQTTLDPAFRLPKSKTPIAWFTGTNDLFYWLPGVVESYRMADGPKHLALLPNFDHALTPELDEQVFAWLDVHLKGAPDFLKVSELKPGKTNREYTWTFEGKRKAGRAELAVSFGPPGNWRGRYWMTIPAKLEGNRCTAEVPFVRGACLAFGTVVDSAGFRSSTVPVEIKGDPRSPLDLPDYNGVAMWAGWDKAGIQFLQLHGLPVPKVEKGAARLGPGKHLLGPVYFTGGVPQRLSLDIRGEGMVQVGVIGTFDGKSVAGETKSIAAGDKWVSAAVDFTPPLALSAGLRVQVIVPEKATAWVRGIRFGPGGK